MAFNNPAFKSALAYAPGQLNYCLARIAEQRQLLELIRSVLPVEIAPYAMHCVIAGDKLIIYTQTAGWASQIRFFQQVILNKLRESGQRNLAILQLKLLRSEPLPVVRKSAVLPSAAMVERLIDDSSNQPDDELSVALYRLGKTLKTRINK